MAYCLERFVEKMQKKDWAEYPQKSVYLILCGLIRHIHDKGASDNIFLDEKNTAFAGLRKLADAQMKSLIDKRLGCDIKRTDLILLHQEEKFWEKGVFGHENGDNCSLYASK